MKAHTGPTRLHRSQYGRGAIFASSAALGLLFLAMLVLAMQPAISHAQSDFADEDVDLLGGAAFGESPQLFSEDGRRKLLVLALSPVDVTESAAEQIGLILQKNISNIHHFSVVGPRETDTLYENSNPELVDCREIACGVESGKKLGADRVLVGRIRRRGEGFYLEVRLIEIVNNLTDYNERVYFEDSNMDEALFRLANSISDNTLMVGRVISTSIRGVVMDLGVKDGLKLGDFLIVYKEEVPIANLEGDVIDYQRKTVAIVKTLRVNDNTAEALVVHSVEDPQVSHFVTTYRNPTRQTLLVENTRRELDTGIRLANRLRPLELSPVALTDTERKQWQYRMAGADAQEGFWFMITAAGGAATGYLFLNYDSGSALTQYGPIAAAVATGYAGWQWLKSREKINDLRVEGRTKGYIQNLSYRLDPGPDGLAFSLSYKF